MSSTMTSNLLQRNFLKFSAIGPYCSGSEPSFAVESSAYLRLGSHLSGGMFKRESLLSSLKPGRGCSAKLRLEISCKYVERGQKWGLQPGASARNVQETSESWATALKSQSVCTEGGEKGWTQAIEEPSRQGFISPGPLQQDSIVFCLVLVGAYVWVRLFDLFTSKGIFGQKLSRKLVHITSGLLFMLCWPFFSSSPWAPFIAGLVPLANGIRLVVYGSGLLKDEGLVKSMSRSGESKELLRGPLYYVLVLYTSTVVFWRRSPIGMIALAMMCGGDGIADIMGRKFGSKKLFYNPEKSWAGSIAMFLFGCLVSFGCMQYFSALGFYQLENSSAALKLAAISLAATIVESLPITSKLDDNFTVPVTALGLGMLLFPM